MRLRLLSAVLLWAALAPSGAAAQGNLEDTSPPPAAAPGETMGRWMATGGHALVAGGILGQVLGGIYDVRPISALGTAGHTLGIPLVGLGALRINEAAVALDGGYHPDYRGWIWYWSGLALTLGGASAFYYWSEVHDEAETDAERDEAETNALRGGMLYAAGGVAQLIAWIKFVRLGNEGHRAVRAKLALGVAPELRLGRGGAPGGRLALTCRF